MSGGLTPEDDGVVTAILNAVGRTLSLEARVQFVAALRAAEERYRLLLLLDLNNGERATVAAKLATVERHARALRRALADAETVELIGRHYPEHLSWGAGRARGPDLPSLKSVTRGLTLLRRAAQSELRRLKGVDLRTEIEPYEWLYGVGLPRVAQEHLSIPPTFSRPESGGEARGAVLLFVVSALNALGLTPPKYETIAKAVARYRKGKGPAAIAGANLRAGRRATLGKISAK